MLLLYSVYENSNYIIGITDAAILYDKAYLKRLNIDYQPLKGLLLAGIEKERDMLLELSAGDIDEDMLKNAFLDFCRMEDKIYFNHRIELEEFKYSTEFVYIVQET